MARYYSAYYIENIATGTPIFQSSSTRYPKLRKIFHWFSGDVDPRDFIHVAPGTRMLDYGSGGGAYLSYFKSVGANISGAEISESMVSRCQSALLDVRHVTDSNKIPFPDREFEVVYLMQVLEHLRDPHEIMRELHRILADDGYIYLAVPNAASVWRKVFGNNWVSGWFSPFHLFVYELQSLKTLVQAHGFAIKQAYSRTPESWFRLNLSAMFGVRHGAMEYRGTRLGRWLIRITAILFLRVLELFVKEKDCLVVKLLKSPRP